VKAAPFDYIRPKSLSEAAALLVANEEARVIAGGQTLVPMMAMRLARPSMLVDIAHIDGLAGIREDGAEIVIGSMTRQAVAETSPLVCAKLPLLAAALPWVGHTPTRNRGTVGGSVVNADPAAEIPLVLTTLEGAVRWQDSNGQGGCRANEFFAGPMSTQLPAGAILTEVRLPVWDGGNVGVGFHEASARRSDFAYVSAAAQVQVDANGRCTRCALGIGGATPFPVKLTGACAALTGSKLEVNDIAAALISDIAALDIMVDGHASPAYRRRVASALATRALTDARAAASLAMTGAGA
jgi:CO/xanthine dehydrogenase FAD-binding subunit